MIKIDFREPTSEDWREWRQECDAARDELVDCVGKGQKPKITDLYKDPRMKEVYKSGEAPFHGKCVYCETNVAASHPGDIEHWRPKNRVTHESGRTIEIETEDGSTVQHPGYYWLAYEWRNLLFACEDCNRPSTAKTPRSAYREVGSISGPGVQSNKEGRRTSRAPNAAQSCRGGSCRPPRGR